MASKKITIAAGLFLLRKDGRFLVGHPTNHLPDFYSIPKGKVEKDELHLQAAIRETFEETNIDVSKYSIIHNFPPVEYVNKKKVLYPFVLFEEQNSIDFSQFDIKCNSFVPEEIGGFPEMDRFKWLTFEEGRTSVHETQISCIDEIEKIYKKITKWVNS